MGAMKIEDEVIFLYVESMYNRYKYIMCKRVDLMIDRKIV